MQTPILVRALGALPGPLWAQAAVLYGLICAPYLLVSFFAGQIADNRAGTAAYDNGVVVIALFLILVLVFSVGLYRLLSTGGEAAPSPSKGPELVTALAITAFSGAVPGLEIYSSGWNPYDVSLWTWDTGTHRILSLMIGWHLGRSVYVLIHNAQQMSATILADQGFELFDPAPLQAPIREGLRNTLIVSSFAAIMTPFLIDPRYWVMVSVIAGLTIAFASLGMILPARGVAQRMARAKADELARISPLIIAKHKQLQNAATDDVAARISTELNAMLDYRQRVEQMREWPFDRSALSRFGLYLLFPVFSWIGAALVERVVDSTL